MRLPLASLLLAAAVITSGACWLFRDSDREEERQQLSFEIGRLLWPTFLIQVRNDGSYTEDERRTIYRAVGLLLALNDHLPIDSATDADLVLAMAEALAVRVTDERTRMLSEMATVHLQRREQQRRIDTMVLNAARSLTR